MLSFKFPTESRALPRSLAALPVALLLAAALPTSQAQADEPPVVPSEIPNFALVDVHSRFHELHRCSSKALVLFFTGNGCPVARQGLHKLHDLQRQFHEEDVCFWVVDSLPDDDRDSILKEGRELKVGPVFPFLVDDSQEVARILGVKRTGTAVVVTPANGKVIYRGAVDDQVVEGSAKPVAEHEYLKTALLQFLHGEKVASGATAEHGCLIHFEATKKAGEITYVHDVAPILENHCVSCHSPGNIGPFAMTGYPKVKGKSDMIQEVLLSRRMPPWSADTEFGHYQGERTMSLDETRTLQAWIDAGCARGEGEDPLTSFKAPVPPAWHLGEPDLVVKLPAPEEVPATGVLEYRHIKVPVPVTEDTWVGAVAIHPGNLKVVHHCIVRVQYKNAKDDGSGRGTWLQGWAPGIQPARFPDGTGRLIPKDAVLDIELHYTTMGSPQTDQTEIGFYKLPARPRMILQNRAIANTEFSINPGNSDAEAVAALPITHDSLLYALSPHMHLRGSWMRYEALYPNGHRETLLSVPNYDFNWQTDYRLLKPKELPAGTWVVCTGGFDNSPMNPSNPDPKKRVAWGDQSFDEMFIGFMETAEVPSSGKKSM